MNEISLSPIDLFWSAGPVGRVVMALLFAASIWCWVLILEGIVFSGRLARALAAASAADGPPLLAPVFEAGRAEAGLTLATETHADRRARIAETMRSAADRVLRACEGGLVNLAVIASVAPFVGLFGTVWGIMTSFVGIAAAKDTSLAVVAPGIAEALAATAWGLAAAIPASIGYTRLGARFSRLGGECEALIGRATTEILRAQAAAVERETAR
jgi:biopolymer transport protein ExbB/TolQ